MTKHKRSTFKGGRKARWGSQPSKIDRHMLSKKGRRNLPAGSA